jgi:hypothetical protein
MLIGLLLVLAGAALSVADRRTLPHHIPSGSGSLESDPPALLHWATRSLL